ncbi:MAG: HAD family acid phosphatase [Phycisphaerales bacterium]
MLKTYKVCRSCAGSLALALVVTGCAHSRHPNLNSTLYALTSAEYEAATRTVYESATRTLAEAKADATWTAALEQRQDLDDPKVQEALTPAVILDIDETVLNNSLFFARIIRDQKRVATGSWDAWVAERRATALNGVIDYVREAKRQGIAVIYLTNRACRKRPGSDAPCPQRSDTIANLKEAGLPALGPDDLVLLRNQQPGWDRDKSKRRAFVCERYRILQIFGDNLGDFAPGNGGPGATLDERRAAIAQYQDKWGSKWFMLPNPMYGPWLNILGDDPETYLSE